MKRVLVVRLLAVGGVLSIVGLAWHQMAILGDGFWTLASGRWILAHCAMPHVDPFAYGSVGVWTLISPGACVVFALVERAVGLRGLMWFGALVEATAVSVLWLSSAKTTHARLILLPLALFFIQVDARDLSCRGQLFGDLGFVLLLGALARLRDGRRVPPWLIVVTTAAWTNLHLSFVAAVFVPLGAAALLTLDPRDVRPRVGPFAAAAGLAAVATLFNPYGPRYLGVALGTAFDPSTRTLDLFQSPDFHDPTWLVAPLLGAALVVLRERFGRDRARHAEQAFILVVLVLACVSRRYVTELLAVEIGVAGAILDPIAVPWPGVLRAATLAVAAFSSAIGVLWLCEHRDPGRDVPVGAAEVAREACRREAIDGEALTRVVDPLHWGGYLAYAWMGDPRYWVDGRDHLFLFGNGVFDDQAALWRGDATSLSLLDTYEAGVVLWVRGAPLDVLLRSRGEWRLIYADRIAVVYVRQPRRPRS